MKVLFIARASLHCEPGGDAIQILSTAKCLRALGVHVDIKLTNEIADYRSYHLLHFFNITRPADILLHLRRSKSLMLFLPYSLNILNMTNCTGKAFPVNFFKRCLVIL